MQRNAKTTIAQRKSLEDKPKALELAQKAELGAYDRRQEAIRREAEAAAGAAVLHRRRGTGGRVLDPQLTQQAGQGQLGGLAPDRYGDGPFPDGDDLVVVALGDLLLGQR